MRAAFICWRPYQLFNAVNMVYNNLEDLKDTSDIYISNLSSLVKCKKNLENLKIFNRVIVFDEGRNRGRIEYITDLINCKKSIVKDIEQEKNVELTYDCIIASGYHSFFVRMANFNRNASCIFMEDGMKSYIETENEKYKRSLLHKGLKTVFKKGIQTVKIEKEYLYHPEYVKERKDRQLCQMPALTSDVIQMINLVFGEAEEGQIKKIIYLTQPLENLMSKQRKGSYEEKDIQKILERYKDLVTVRIHPRYREYRTLLNIDESEQMWELRAANLCSDNILISIFSTASFTPFFLMNRAPILILLYKIAMKEESIYKEAELFISKITHIYPNIIYVPDSLEEMDIILSDLKRKHYE